jgi:hypothetical protein
MFFASVASKVDGLVSVAPKKLAAMTLAAIEGPAFDIDQACRALRVFRVAAGAASTCSC